LFAEGKSIREVAQAISRAESTTVQYLIEFIEREQIDSPSPWVDEATSQAVSDTARRAGTSRLKPIFDQLGGRVPYDRIRISMACLRHQEILDFETEAPTKDFEAASSDDLYPDSGN